MNVRSLTPAQDELEARRKREEIELCGKNRGPHDYIPIEWKSDKDKKTECITRFMCRICFNNIDTMTLLANYKDISQPGNRGTS